jgi:hypothetical protein
MHTNVLAQALILFVSVLVVCFLVAHALHDLPCPNGYVAVKGFTKYVCVRAS